MLPWVCHGGSCNHKGGARVVDPLTQPPQPPQDQGRVAAKDACSSSRGTVQAAAGCSHASGSLEVGEQVFFFIQSREATSTG